MPAHVRSPLDSRVLSRRQLLGGLAAVAVGAAAPILVSRPSAALGGSTAGDPAAMTDWSSPDTWGGAVPGPGDVVRVSKPIRLDVDARVQGLVIEPTGHLLFAADRDVTLTSDGNVEVYGLLEMRPDAAEHNHLLLFPSVNEAAFVGGGMDVMATDVGLWVRDCGRLLLEGTPRTAWVRADGEVHRDATTLRLKAVPEGWQRGDELVLTPTGRPTDERHYDEFDEVRIREIVGNDVTLDRPVRYAHPAVEVGDGVVLTTEVLNLTRNVRVEGTPSGRTHTNMHTCCETSVVRYAAFRHFGPRKADGRYTEPVLGRYGLHWHMLEDCSRGTVVEGVVARDGGNHAFVAHNSHGVRHTSCISYNTVESAYWWDQAGGERFEAPPSHDTLYDSCVAARVKAEPAFRGYMLAGFHLGSGDGSVARNCVATGVQGNRNAAGFMWVRSGVWTFTDCVTHNNRVHGLHIWQNTWMKHVIERFVSYHNGAFGLRHGAYRNGYLYRDAILYGNLAGGVELHANSRATPVLRFENLLIDGAGLSPFAVQAGGHVQPPEAPTEIHGCRMRGYTKAGIGLTGAPRHKQSTVDLIDVVRCRFSDRAFWLSRTVRAGSLVRVQSSGFGRLSIRPRHSRGRLRRPWNARVRRISAFGRSRRPRSAGLEVALRSPS